MDYILYKRVTAVKRVWSNALVAKLTSVCWTVTGAMDTPTALMAQTNKAAVKKQL